MPVTDQEPQEQTPEEKFRQEQKALAADQNAGEVPETRPIASQEPNPANQVSDLTKRLRDEGVIDNDPMPLSAFEKADSYAQKKKAAKESVFEALKVGDMARTTKGPHRDRVVALVRVISYRSNADLAIQISGRPEANFVQPDEFECSARGDDRDGESLILSVDKDGLVKIANWLGTGRG